MIASCFRGERMNQNLFGGVGILLDYQDARFTPAKHGSHDERSGEMPQLPKDFFNAIIRL